MNTHNTHTHTHTHAHWHRGLNIDRRPDHTLRGQVEQDCFGLRLHHWHHYLHLPLLLHALLRWSLVCACVRVCVCACVRACVRVRVRVCASLLVCTSMYICYYDIASSVIGSLVHEPHYACAGFCGCVEPCRLTSFKYNQLALRENEVQYMI